MELAVLFLMWSYALITRKAFRPSCAARHPAEAQRSQRVIVNTAKEYASEIPSVFMWLGGPQEHYDEKGKFLEIIKDIHLRTFPDHMCEIKES